MNTGIGKKYLRIAMLGHKRVPSREGGIEVVVGELSSRMCRLGHSVTCYNRKGHHIAGTEFDTEKNSNIIPGVTIKEVFTIDKKGLAAITASFFAAIYAAFGKFDVVHFHAEGPCSMLWLPKLFGKKCIATIHGLDHQRAKWGKFASLYIKFGEKCAVKFADEIIVLSKNVQEYFLNEYGVETMYIPNGVSKPQLVDADLIKAKYNLDKDSYILFLGRLVPEKGITYLIEAFKKVNTSKKLVIVGGSSDTIDFENELKAMADERIIFTGFTQGRMLEEFYSNAYLYVLPSDLEGMPISLLEAMSYGNCCITSDIPECTEVVGEYGISFEKGNVEALREKLQSICDNPELVKHYKQIVSDYVCAKFDWNNVVNETLRVYADEYDKICTEEEKIENTVSQ